MDVSSKIQVLTNDEETDVHAPLLEEDTVDADINRSQQLNEAAIRQLPQYVATITATLGAFCLGTVLAWTSPTGERLKQGALGFKITDSQLSWVGSLAGLGAALTAPMAGVLIDKIGRRGTMITLTLPLSFGWALVAFAVNLPMLYSGRIITGACGGAFSVAAPVYISEIAHKSRRGTLGSLFQLMVVIGLEFTYLLGPAVPVFWLSVASGIIPLLALACLVAFAPESPVYLLRGGRLNAAHASLTWLRGHQYDTRGELNNMSDPRASGERPLSFWQIIFQRPMLIAGGLMAFQQFSGINDMVFYTEEIFLDAGGSVQGSAAAAIVGGVQVAATLLASIVVDRTGRRLLLLISGAVMAGCCTTLGLFFKLREWKYDVSSLGWLPLSSLCLYFIVFSLGFGPIPWLMLGELFAPEVKGIAGSVASSISWWLTFLVTFVFTDVVHLIGEGVTFWIFAGCCAVGVIFVAIFVPETKGKSLEEIQREMGSR